LLYILFKGWTIWQQVFWRNFFSFTNYIIISLQVTSPRTMKTTSLTGIYSNCLLSLFLEFQVSQSTYQDLVAFQVHPADLPRRFLWNLMTTIKITQQPKPLGHLFTLGTGSSLICSQFCKSIWEPFKKPIECGLFKSNIFSEIKNLRKIALRDFGCFSCVFI